MSIWALCVYVIVAIYVWGVAERLGHNGFGYFVLSIIGTPIVALLGLIALGRYIKPYQN
ncbi:hypothetical protein HUO09_05625 [Vibrio sp. Y2-5]|uniref:hypothetical protein n=1 Tax=Vibrio sp. Y2-5 TaxID=2743977 RepID=UPI0016610BAE|nr:hypothetical protein [Vibrio sp. Y2-5]MBD0785811.1 hypothetical protein [Vibrio sp. Y2-5]